MPGIKGEFIYNDKGEIIGATGAKLAAMNMKKKYGEDYYHGIGSIGGKTDKGGKRGFASEKVGKDGLTGLQRASIHGKRGGAKSRRNRDNGSN